MRCRGTAGPVKIRVSGVKLGCIPLYADERQFVAESDGVTQPILCEPWITRSMFSKEISHRLHCSSVLPTSGVRQAFLPHACSCSHRLRLYKPPSNVWTQDRLGSRRRDAATRRHVTEEAARMRERSLESPRTPRRPRHALRFALRDCASCQETRTASYTVPVLPVLYRVSRPPPPRPVSFYQNLIRDTPEPYRPHVTCVSPGSPAPRPDTKT